LAEGSPLRSALTDEQPSHAQYRRYREQPTLVALRPTGRTVENDPKPTLGIAYGITSAHADWRSKGHGRKDLPLETRNQFSHPHANAFKFHTCGARPLATDSGTLPNLKSPLRMLSEYSR
jgi:hypothetical protein